MLIGDVTANAKKKTGLPFPTNAAPSAVNPVTPSLPGATPTPTSVADALKNTTGTIDQAKTALTATQPFLDNYLKPNAAGTTPFRQALTNTKASTTADAYDNAIARSREKAAVAGFASNPQPITYGAEAGIANERAKAIADIPNKVNLEAQPVEMQAAQLQQQQPGILNALANTQNQQASILEQQRSQEAAIAEQQRAQAAQQKATLAGGLAQTGISVATPLIKQALTKTVAPAVAAATAAGAATPSLAAIAAGTVPELPTAAIGGAGLAGMGGGAAAPGGGLGASLGALASNPVTWAVAGAITAAIVWSKTQAHHEASTFVRDYQDQFANDKGTGHLNKVVDEFDKVYSSGQLDKASATAARNETAALIEKFKADTNAFSQKGSDENRVAMQAAQRMTELFGPNWERILGKMDSEIAGLA